MVGAVFKGAQVLLFQLQVALVKHGELSELMLVSVFILIKGVRLPIAIGARFIAVHLVVLLKELVVVASGARLHFQISVVV